MLHPWTRLTWVSDEIGYGVIATRPIPMGTILWALDPLDRILGPAQVETLDPALWPVLETYSYINRNGHRILCWDHGRFMNHSCEPVSLSPGVDFELAVRDIEAGEEITCDYSSLNLEQDLDCLCGSPRCRGRISSGDFADLAPQWDEQLQRAVAQARNVTQPLLPWVDAKALGRWSRRPASLPSALIHHHAAGDAVTAYRRSGTA